MTYALPKFAVLTKWFLLGALGLTLCACGGGGDNIVVPAPTQTPVQTTVTLLSAMSGDQELPPTVTGALGTGTLSLEFPSLKLSGSFTVNGMKATDGHIHLGTAGENGPMAVSMTTESGGEAFTVPANTVLTSAQATAFADGGLYFNAHTLENPTGEVRGQIGRDVFAAQMSNAQEVPTNASMATGNGLLSFDPATRKITARMTLTGMAATIAHIHSGSLGANGPVLIELRETTAGSGIWLNAVDAVLTDAQFAILKAGGLYFNAHSAVFPGGEIRGQIGLNAKFARLNAAQEVPTNASTATGTGTLVVDPLTRRVNGSVTLAGMSATAAHIHLGTTGFNGPVVISLARTSTDLFSVPANTVITADQYKAYKQGNLYYNAHSGTFPSSDIRGQIR